MKEQSSITGQLLDLPTGGGAIRGIGEKFAPELFTGTGKHSIPIELPPGRNGFHPKLNLNYSSAHGNGYFGIGWELSVPSVRRRTSHGVPKYDETQDVFVLSGVEDLVPVETSGNRTRFRPRTEASFARIDRIFDRAAADDYWRVQAPDGLISLYGTPGMSGSSDPASITKDATRKFAWMITRTTDLFGNRIEYTYSRDVPDAAGAQGASQPLLRQLRYAETVDAGGAEKFLITVTFDYEDRADRSSDCRAGFEIRTRKRCSRILVETHFDRTRPVRHYELRYREDPLSGLSLLREFEVVGYDDLGQARREMPPLAFSWTEFDPVTAAQQGGLSPVTGIDQPESSLAAPNYELVDLSGDGLPDVLRMDGVTRYWSNLGDASLGRCRIMSEAPPVTLSTPGVSLIDADGDARIDLFVNSPRGAGSYALNFSGEWDERSYKRQQAAPGFDLADPLVRFLDLDGDGVTDVLRTGATLETWINDRTNGWKLAAMTPRQPAAHFPDVFFSDRRVKLADMNGDGLQDIVMVHSGRVDYWPSFGHGQWGQRVTMQHAPQLPPNYDPRRLLMGDIDGDGAADLLYIENDCVRLWINRSGNSWSEEITIHGTPPFTDLDSVRLTDFLGQGVSGILWSRDAGSMVEHRLLFLDLSGGTAPRLLSGIDNQMGAVTRIKYAPSTRFYLDDEKDASTRWQTRLPFPVQVVERVEVSDLVGQSRLCNRYRYRHGYWDGIEREFRGFGLVEQYDTETFEQWHCSGTATAAHDFSSPDRRQLYSPPTLTKTWFHLGAVRKDGEDWTELDYSAEYTSADSALLGQQATFPVGLSHSAKRDATRALRGTVLHTELYALDGSDRESLPFTVFEAKHEVAKVDTELVRADDPAHVQRDVFVVRATAERTTQWERGNDPRTTFKFTGEFDSYGRPHMETELACPRGWRAMGDRPTEPFLTKRTRHDYATRDDAAGYVIDRVACTAVYELKNNGLERLADMRSAPDPPATDLLQHKIIFYDGPAFTGLPFAQLGEYAAPVRVEELALTETLLVAAFGAVPVYLESDLPDWQSHPKYPAEFRAAVTAPKRAGYVFSEGSDGVHVKGWYVVTQAHCYDTQRPPANGHTRGLVVALRDPLGHETTFDYFSELLTSSVTTPNRLTTSVEYDLRALRPQTVIEPNGNSQIFRWTPLGLVGGVRQQGSNNTGDQARETMSFVYEFQNFRNGRQQGRVSPVLARTIRHTEHDTSSDPDTTIEMREYSDGFGRLVQARTQAADVIYGTLPFADGVLASDQSAEPNALLEISGVEASPNAQFVVVSGSQTFDNKGRIVETFEPLYAAGWDYAPPSPNELRARTTYFQDPLGRVVRVVHPDGSEDRNVYGQPRRIDEPDDYFPSPWETFRWDANDNAGRTHPAKTRTFEDHRNTPSSSLIDPLARIIRSTNRKGPALGDEVTTRSKFDLRGNLTEIIDAFDRIAGRSIFDLLNRRLLLDSIDAGAKTSLADAAGNLIEARDGRGALALDSYDGVNRPIRTWARDNGADVITLRENLIYGDDQQNGLSLQQAVDANLLGRLYRHYDEAGVLTCERYDFHGNCVRQTRQLIGDDAILAGYDPIAPRAFRVDWEAPPLLDPLIHEIDGSYDALNRQKTLTFPQAVDRSRRTLRASYDRSGALESVRVDAQTVIKRLAYDARGQRVLALWGNGLITRYAYDSTTTRLLRRRTERVSVIGLRLLPRGNTLEDVVYDYDLVGNILSLHHREEACGLPAHPNRLDRLFTYDPLYRLATATGRESDTLPPTPPWEDRPRQSDPSRVRAYTERYAYDNAGNLLGLEHNSGGNGDFRRSMTLATDSNRLLLLRSRGTTFPLSYDASGNQTGEGQSRKFEWDHNDRLRAFFIQATPGNAASSFTNYLYDSEGNRLKKVTRNQQGQTFATTYIGGVFEHHREQTDENDTLHVTDGPRRLATIRIGTPFRDDSTPGVKFTYTDHLYSCVLTTDVAGQRVSREEYTPWGDTSYGSFARKKYRWSGKERDAESGLYYYGARYYASGQARWISCDPAGGMNLYSAFANNPICFIDPIGEQEEPVVAGVTTTSTPSATDVATGSPGGPTKDLSVLDQVKRDPCLQNPCIRAARPNEVKIDAILERDLYYQELLRILHDPKRSEMDYPKDLLLDEIQARYDEIAGYVNGNTAASNTTPDAAGSNPSQTALVQLPPSGSGVPAPNTPTAGAGEGWFSRLSRKTAPRVFAYVLSALAPRDIDNPTPGEMKPSSDFVKGVDQREERRDQAKPKKPETVPPPPLPKPRMRVNLHAQRNRQLRYQQRTARPAR